MAARSPNRRGGLCAALAPVSTLAAVWLWMASASAAPASSEPARAQAEAALKEGNALFAAGQYQRALERYQAAQSLVASPKLLFNFGQTYRQLGRDVEAIEAYERFLAEVPDAAPDLRRQAQQRIGELLGRIGHAQISADLDGAEVVIDGKSRGTTPLAAPVRLAPGPHQVVVQPPGSSGAPFVERIEIQGGRSVLVRARFAAPAAAARPPAPATAADAVVRRDAPPAAPKEPTVPALRRAGQVTVAAAVVLAVAGAVMVGSSWMKYSDARDGGCVGRGSCDQDASYISRRNTQALVLLGAAGAAAVTGGLLWYLNPIAPAPGQVGLVGGAAWSF
jgi:hypothetical protein